MKKLKVVMLGVHPDATGGISTVVSNWMESGIKSLVDFEYISTLDENAPGHQLLKLQQAIKAYFRFVIQGKSTMEIPLLSPLWGGWVKERESMTCLKRLSSWSRNIRAGLKSALEKLCGDKALRESMGKESLALIDNKFNIKTIVKQISSLYNELKK